MNAKYPPVSAPNYPGKNLLRGERGNRTRLSSGIWREHARAWTTRAWLEIVLGALLVIVLLIFILQNNTRTEISFLPWSFTLPLGVALLFATIGGLLVMALAGGARIWQLRHQRVLAAKKHDRVAS